jgi:hypothetical protein
MRSIQWCHVTCHLATNHWPRVRRCCSTGIPITLGSSTQVRRGQTQAPPALNTPRRPAPCLVSPAVMGFAAGLRLCCTSACVQRDALDCYCCQARSPAVARFHRSHRLSCCRCLLGEHAAKPPATAHSGARLTALRIVPPELALRAASWLQSRVNQSVDQRGLRPVGCHVTVKLTPSTELAPDACADGLARESFV